MTINIRFRYTARDLEQAQRLMRELRPREAWLYRMIGPAFGVAAALGILLFLRGYRIIGVVCVVGSGLLSYLALAMPRFQARAAFKRFPYLQQEISAVFNEEGIELTTSSGRAWLPWAGYSHFREDANVFILRRSDNHVQVFPKRALSAQQLSTIRELAQRRIDSDADSNESGEGAGKSEPGP